MLEMADCVFGMLCLATWTQKSVYFAYDDVCLKQNIHPVLTLIEYLTENTKISAPPPTQSVLDYAIIVVLDECILLLWLTKCIDKTCYFDLFVKTDAILAII